VRVVKKTKAAGERGGADAPVEPPLTKVYRFTLPLRQIVYRPDWTDRGYTPIEPPKVPYGAQDYLTALRELVDSIVDRYGGPDEFDRFFRRHLDGVPADATVARAIKYPLQRLQEAIAANDVFGAISATVAIERALAAPWTGFNQSTGYKSAQARKQNGAAVKRAEFDAIKGAVERLLQENAHLSRDAAIERAAKRFGRSRAWFYRWKKSFGDP
jgi:hypothetical protein